MTSRDAKKIETLMTRQQSGEHMYCPRCGKDQMDPKPVHNALSRYANVYICDSCGLMEAMDDFAAFPPLPFEEWAAAQW